MHLWRPSDRGSTAQPSFMASEPCCCQSLGSPFPLSLLQSLVQGQALLRMGWVQGTPSQIHHITSHRIALVASQPGPFCILLLMCAGLTSDHMAAEGECVSRADGRDTEMERDYGIEGQHRAGQGPTAGPQVISCRLPQDPRGSPNVDNNKRCLQRRFELCPPPDQAHPHPPCRRLSQRFCHRKPPLLAKVQ